MHQCGLQYSMRPVTLVKKREKIRKEERKKKNIIIVHKTNNVTNVTVFGMCDFPTLILNEWNNCTVIIALKVTVVVCSHLLLNTCHLLW